ncbi:MAG TPA: hypothetical protein VK869_01315 [Rubrobacteraceae bacterium]|nr:hypothetical protein [Rubrobacteraceae bacterium]
MTGVVGLYASSFHRRVRKLGRFLEPSRRAVVASGSENRRYSFSVYGVKPHVPCLTNRPTLSYELTQANASEVKLTQEVVDGAELEGVEGDLLVRRLLQTSLPERGVGGSPVAEIAAYTYGFYAKRVLGRPQGRIEELWA